MGNTIFYISPTTKTLEIAPEEILCGSNEFVDENVGEW